jgi:hypothetical protein
MEIKNKNFISNLMTKKDVILGFGEKPENLIAQGFLKRYYQYFRPTLLLWQELIPKEIEIQDVGRINGFNNFSYKTIQEIFNCDNTTARVIANLYFTKTPYGFFKRSELLNQNLADGETILKLKGAEDAVAEV